MKTVTKSDLANIVAQKLGLSTSSCEDIVNQVLESAINLVERGNALHIKNFGSFEIFTKKSRPGRNISKNTSVVIPEKKVMRFSASRTLRNTINNKL